MPTGPSCGPIACLFCGGVESLTPRYEQAWSGGKLAHRRERSPMVHSHRLGGHFHPTCLTTLFEPADRALALALTHPEPGTRCKLCGEQDGIHDVLDPRRRKGLEWSERIGAWLHHGCLLNLRNQGPYLGLDLGPIPGLALLTQELGLDNRTVGC